MKTNFEADNKEDLKEKTEEARAEFGEILSTPIKINIGEKGAMAELSINNLNIIQMFAIQVALNDTVVRITHLIQKQYGNVSK